jgi:1-acyl-sn-glycerol-3-phosphate acyltransferase
MKKAWFLVRSSITFLIAGLGTVGIALAVVIASAIQPRGRFCERLLNCFGRLWVTVSGIRLEVSGLEHIERGVTYIVVANHRSNLDIMTLIRALPIPVRFLSKREVFQFPLMGAAMRGAGMVPLDREMGRKELTSIIRHTRLLVSEGRSLVVFPEGTRSLTGDMLPFKSGAFFIAAQVGCPVLPVAISGTHAVWPPQSSIIRGGPVKVEVMPPITITRRAARQSRQLADQIRSDLIGVLARI